MYLTRILSFGAQDRNVTAMETGRSVLMEMGVTKLPLRPNTLNVLVELIKTKIALRSHTEESLKALPALENKKWRQAMSIIDMMQAIAYCSDINFFAVMNLRMVRWTVKHGVCIFSPSAFATYGIILAGLNELNTARSMGK